MWHFCSVSNFLLILSATVTLVASQSGSGTGDRDTSFCVANQKNCGKSKYLKTVCPVTCGVAAAPAKSICTTGSPAKETCSDTTSCPDKYFCYRNSCCPLPVCNDGVSRSTQICSLQSRCEKGYLCQNSGCCKPAEFKPSITAKPSNNKG